jgi:hypothetical protein
MPLTKVSYPSMIEGSVKTSADLSSWASSGELSCGISQTITLSSDVSISHTKTVSFLPGGKIIVPTGLTLTIDGRIEAGDQWIFECVGTGKVVASDNNYGDTANPSNFICFSISYVTAN